MITESSLVPQLFGAIFVIGIILYAILDWGDIMPYTQYDVIFLGLVVLSILYFVWFLIEDYYG